jgi:hypothetical protein
LGDAAPLVVANPASPKWSPADRPPMPAKKKAAKR